MNKVSFLSEALVDKSGETKKFILDDTIYNHFIYIMRDRYKEFKEFKEKIDDVVKINIENRNINIEDKFNNLCKMFNKEFHQPIHKKKVIETPNRIEEEPRLDHIKLNETKYTLKLPSGLPIIEEMHIIGRMETIDKATQYNSPIFKALYLPDNQPTIQWSTDINDAYILCAYMKSRINQDNNINTNDRKFSLLLIVDKDTRYNKFINTKTINADIITNQDEKIKTNCEKTCIFPPFEEYTIDTPSTCKIISDKKACYSKIPSVTFTEIILLTRHFGMDCYHLDNYNSGSGKYYDLYFFSIKDCQNPNNNSMMDVINKFNKNNEKNNEKLKLTQVKVLPESKYTPFNCKPNKYKLKYLKYKGKYLALKNKMYEKHDTK